MVRRQKEVVKPSERFNKGESELFGGHSKVLVFDKKTKSGSNKQFAFKSFKINIKKFKVPKDEADIECSLEKLTYDVLALCGVSVPKTYIVQTNQETYLASRIAPNSKTLFAWLGGELSGKFITSFPKPEECLPKQAIRGKPIVGLFEHVAAYIFVGDSDAVGSQMGNIILVEEEKQFRAIKIDPGLSEINCSEERRFSSGQDPETLNNLLQGKVYDLGYGFYDIFQYATREQCQEGVKRIAQLEDKAIYNTVFNPQIPFLSQELRKEIYDTLIARRDAFKKALELHADAKGASLSSARPSSASSSSPLGSPALFGSVPEPESKANSYDGLCKALSDNKKNRFQYIKSLTKENFDVIIKGEFSNLVRVLILFSQKEHLEIISKMTDQIKLSIVLDGDKFTQLLTLLDGAGQAEFLKTFKPGEIKALFPLSKKTSFTYISNLFSSLFLKPFAFKSFIQEYLGFPYLKELFETQGGLIHCLEKQNQTQKKTVFSLFHGHDF